ncbi:hypothetical protein G6O69_14115 [Pseudenhygromyxa sp. WMMC2535]|uniref:hypothetical protein n=1 Tax=Pseudenhygromyxa sp. WMMC2535 TaxID=2712867 RepID=UPI001552A613|nr:hypothetical protein [Pseudenhygromyxa sp. WMMC2535]NVB38973.1 hypothetical protein [Pseudenhygromyxa sp. WMMC2535]
MNTRNITVLRTLACVSLAALTCACIARGPEDYRKVTRSLVDTKKSEIEACFGDASGKVVVNFTVAKKTGAITDPEVDTAKSSASAEVGACVAEKIDGLTLEQPDMRDGDATFTWQFTN